MKLHTVTATGADDNTSVRELLGLADCYPFAEFGILVSASQVGVSRFPSREWIRELQRRAAEYNASRQPSQYVKLSLHLCGEYVRDLLVGRFMIPFGLLQSFERVQLNFHGERRLFEADNFAACIGRNFGERTIIFQLDGGLGDEYLQACWERERLIWKSQRLVPLFDQSHGAGVLPGVWPEAEYMADDSHHSEHGYAGGLGPDNVAAELPKIAAAAKATTPVWIDAETKLRARSGGVDRFSLDLVDRFLLACRDWVGVER